MIAAVYWRSCHAEGMPMKIRTDFVTNSSSANYSVSFALESDAGATAGFGVRSSGGEFTYDGSELHQGLLGRIAVDSVSFVGLPFRCVPDDWDLDHVIRSLIGSMELGFVKTEHRYNPYLTHGPRFLIVGDPQLYESHEALEDAIGRVGEVVTWPPDADIVICCGRAQNGAESYGKYDWLDAIHDIRGAVLEAGIELADPDIEYLGDGYDWRVNIADHLELDERDAEWRLLTDLQGVDQWEPLVITEQGFSFFDPEGPVGVGSLSLMPGALAAFGDSCAEHGVTRENLRFVRVYGRVMTFGDSAWYVDDREDDWCLGVRDGAVEESHNIIRRAGE